MKRLALGLFLTAAPIGQYSQLVVFGDSLSDSGNVLGLQATNGDVWARQLGATGQLNYAYLGAQAAGNGDLIPDVDAPGIDQVDLFLANEALNPFAPDLGANPIAAVWAGGNDILNAGTDAAAVQAGIAGALGALKAGMVRLSAEIDSFLLFNLPDFGALPRYVGTPFAAAASALSGAFNAGIAQLAGTIRGLGPTVIEVDIAGLFEKVAADKEAYGFTSLTRTCNRGAVCDGLFFWDDIHPTEAAHRLIAGEVRRLTAPPPPVAVPVPGAGLMLALGLGALALARRRVGSGAA